ncbi:Protein of uncharacterised function (DUF1602) [Pseudomonas aeruginosa]|nr:Protein of uncharacterised function (DUF1602) [Pseudomonas aeruginosa]
MFEPNAPICAITWRLLPSPTASMTTTEATPMMIPSRVSAVRNRLIHITRQAARTASSSSARQAPEGSLLPSARRWLRSSACRWRSTPALGCAGRSSLALSLTISPSRTSMMRLARAATSRSWVIRITTWPWLASSSSSAMTSAPLWLSRAPVGSSARMIWPPFISARAIDTRCCWPPDNWCGRLAVRSARPRRSSRARARVCRSLAGVPA